MVKGVGRFLDANHVEVIIEDGSRKVVQFNHAIIAAGSEAVKLPFIPDDPRVIDSTGALALEAVPERMLVIGGGIVGVGAGDLIAEAAHAIEMGSNAADIGLTVHPHPTLSETVAMAAEAFEGTITDLYMPKKRWDARVPTLSAMPGLLHAEKLAAFFYVMCWC